MFPLAREKERETGRIDEGERWLLVTCASALGMRLIMQIKRLGKVTTEYEADDGLLESDD